MSGTQGPLAHYPRRNPGSNSSDFFNRIRPNLGHTPFAADFLKADIAPVEVGRRGLGHCRHSPVGVERAAFSRSPDALKDSK